MSFADAVRSVFRQYAGFEGRARRSEFWYFYLFAVLVTTVPYVLGLILLAAGGGGLTGETPEAGAGVFAGIALLAVSGLVGLALLVPQIAVAVRRLHDTGRSGYWYLLSLIPFGGLVLIVFWAMDSDPGTNVHGPNPKQAASGLGYGQAPTLSYGTGTTVLPGDDSSSGYRG